MQKSLKIFDQGYFAGNGTMVKEKPVTVKSYNAAFELVATEETTIDVNGNVPFECPEGSHYASVGGHGMLTVFSAVPFDENYDFTTSADKACGANQKEVEPGVFAAYCGDFNDDGFVDAADFPQIETDIANSVHSENGEFILTDLNGDGVVDQKDLDIFEKNAELGLQVIRP